MAGRCRTPTRARWTTSSTRSDGPALSHARFRCLLCGLPGLATDPCLRRTTGELGALRRHAAQAHELSEAALAASAREEEVGRVVWRLADGRAWLEAAPADG